MCRPWHGPGGAAAAALAEAPREGAAEALPGAFRPPAGPGGLEALPPRVGGLQAPGHSYVYYICI